MEIEVRTMLGQAIDVFKEYIKTKGNLEIDYHLEDYMQVIINYINVLELENESLKERIEYLERSNNRREDTILEQRQEISDLKDNWDKLKEHLTNRYNNGTESISYREVFIEIKEMMKELEQGSDSNE